MTKNPGKVVAIRQRVVPKKDKKTVTKAKVGVYVDDQNYASKRTIKSWLNNKRNGRLYARGVNKGLQVMAARGLLPSDSQWGLARIAGPDPMQDQRWIVKFKGDTKCFERSIGFHQFKIADRVRVCVDANGDSNEYRTETVYPREWVMPVHVLASKAHPLRSLL